MSRIEAALGRIERILMDGQLNAFGRGSAQAQGAHLSQAQINEKVRANAAAFINPDEVGKAIASTEAHGKAFMRDGAMIPLEDVLAENPTAPRDTLPDEFVDYLTRPSRLSEVAFPPSPNPADPAATDPGASEGAVKGENAANSRQSRAFLDIAMILGEDPQKLPREFLERRYLGAREIATRMANA